MTEIIGNGEVTALSILKKEYGDSIEYSTQIQFKDLMSDEFKDGLSERQMKESVDIVLYTLFDTICIRVQGRDHKGVLKSSRDIVQKQMLEWSNCKVVDLWWYDCPTLFKNIENDESKRELMEAIDWVFI
jgi:hypothetical protein|tara:strand:- start:452 stop:841 length:390 start_codon:yes stop_codon:yes gene_type:complete